MIKYTILSLLLVVTNLFGQLTGNEKRYARIGSLQSHFSAYGSERAWNGSYYEGLRWPADYPMQDNSVIKRAWLAAEDFLDTAGTVHDYTSIYFYEGDVGTTLFPIELTQTAKHSKPTVMVDGAPCGYLLFDTIDSIEPGQIADRIITNVVNTSMGLTQTREIFIFSQEYHDNYFIKRFTFKNTGNIDWDPEIELNDSLRGVRIGWGTRYSGGREGASAVEGHQRWGKHSWVTRRGEDYADHYLEPITPANPIANWLRSGFEWVGQSEAITWDNIGAPDLIGSGRLTSPKFVGSVLLHADISATDASDDINQPVFLGWHAGDRYPDRDNHAAIYHFLEGNPFPGDSYGGSNRMDDALESITHRLDPYTIHGDGGGTNLMMTYGPYDLAHGESITIVEAEGINGLRRELCQQIGERWKTAYETPGDTGPFDLPDGSTTTDKDFFKNTWVYTGQDSILKTFGRAKRNFDADFNIVSPPKPPPFFSVESDTAMIQLSWEPSPSEAEASFSGYQIYRAVGTYDTTYQLIAELGGGMTSFIDAQVESGRSHFYYIQSVSDGSENDDIGLNPSGPLKSSRFYTMTRFGAFSFYPTSSVVNPGESNFYLKQNFPNPFNPVTRIQYSIGECTDLSIGIYDVLGRRIKTIALSQQSQGKHEIVWDATNDYGELVSTGVYYFQIRSARQSESIKMLYLR